jgi:uncharacterized protein (TIGR02145 family)
MQVYTNNNDDDKLMALTDIRDGQVYLVGKLADGNCWMLNNLKLGSLVNDITLTPADTNVTTDWVLPRIDNTNVNPYYDAPRLYAFVAGQSNFSTTKPNSEEVNIDSKDFAGYYYNWCAATAGTLSTTCTPQIVMPTDAVQDICPAGWRIPKGGNAGDTSNEFDQLSAKMAGYTDNQGQYEDDFDYFDPTFIENFLFEGPFRGVLAGSGGSWVNLGLYGYIWSMSYTTYSAQNAFGLSFAESSIIPVWRGGGRGASLSVRCLLKP